MKAMRTFLMLLALSLAPSLHAQKACDNFCGDCSSSSSSSSSSCECPDAPQFGYFYITNEQTLPGGSFEEVFWIDSSSTHTNGILVNPNDPCEILIKKRGLYLATYIVTADTSTPVTGSAKTDTNGNSIGFQLALYLNDGDTPIPGSTYATDVCDNFGGTKGTINNLNPVNMKGSLIFHVLEQDSTLTLVNQCENTIHLNNEAGTCFPYQFGNNVSASLYIQRLSNQQFE